MANTSHVFGFRPSRYQDSAPYTGAVALYGHSASNSGTIFKGDMVQIDDTNRSTALADAYAPGIPFVKAVTGAMTTTVYRGVAAGFVPQPEFSQLATASLGTMYVIASTARYVWVVDDFDVIFEVQESGTNSYVTAASNAINMLTEVGTVSSGNTTTGVSGMTVAGAGATTNLPWRILRLTQKPDNFLSLAADTTPNWHWDVMMANQDLVTLKVGL